ncbi:MAG: helix-turn-helix transcriptional regulator [Gammaproteobacteria bacterium]|nr:helix-turn-helix transcriptional regulator [Gammaproteobacteria bacterium]MCP5202180.1 helix-turn-helix transcriptional regulator [Gammaproteobacteria bacterium]
MAQTSQLIDALKRALRARGLTYTDVAAELGLSLASVKRLFAEETLSLKRIDAICALLDMEMTDLLKTLDAQERRLHQLSEAQEAAIAGDIKLLLVTVAVLNRLGIPDILARFRIDEHECTRRLAWLDRQGLIDLLPGNRVRLRVASNFTWRAGGPIQRFFRQRLGTEYFEAGFDAEGECLIVLNGLVTVATATQFKRRLERLAAEFEALNEDDAGEPVAARSGHTVVLAMRPWVFGAFADYLR